MMVEKQHLELKVGVFVFIGLVIFGFFVLMIGDFRIINPGYEFEVVFGFANGVTVSAPVRLSGVEVGEVRGITIGYDEKEKKPIVKIDVWVQRAARIPVDSRIWVNMLGLLGEKYIEIIPGEKQDELVTAGSVVRGEDPISIQELTDLSREIALQVKDTVADVSVTLSDLSTTLKGATTTLTRVDLALDSVNTILGHVKSGEGNIGRLFYDDSLYTNIDEMFLDLKKNPWKLLTRPKGQ